MGQELRRIVDTRANLHSAPAEGKKMRAFLVKGDVVGVIAESGDWLHVEYPDKGKTTRGWVRAGALSPAVAGALRTKPAALLARKCPARLLRPRIFARGCPLPKSCML